MGTEAKGTEPKGTEGHPQQKVRLHSRKRMIWATVCAVTATLLFILLGPSRDSIKKKFEFSGKEGPLKIMPELSIDDGSSDIHQDKQKMPSKLPTAPEYEVEDPNAMKAELPPPMPPNTVTEVVDEANVDPDLDVLDAVELLMPTQTNPWFKLIRMVRPHYPADASQEDLDQPTIKVEVAFFVSPTGVVSGSYIINCTGSNAFKEVTLKAVDEWLYQPLNNGDSAPDGFWNRLTINFRSPVNRRR
jgi:Gram-negative bacterial TonB protein C-terminal